MSAIIAAGLTIMTALFLTPLFRNLPEATLAAIVINAVWSFFDVPELRRYARLSRPDYIFAMVALVGVLIFGVIPGLILAVSISIIMLVYLASRPHLSILGKEPEKENYSDIERHPQNQTLPGLLIIHPDSPLFFANATLLRERIQQLIQIADPAVQVVVLDMESSGRMDITSVDALADLQQDLATNSTQLWLARVHTQTRPILEDSSLAEAIGAEHFYATVQDAVNAFNNSRISDGSRN